MKWWLVLQFVWLLVPINHHCFLYSSKRTANTLAPVFDLVNILGTLMQLVSQSTLSWPKGLGGQVGPTALDKSVLYRSWRTKAGPFESPIWRGANVADMHMKKDGEPHTHSMKGFYTLERKEYTHNNNNKHSEEKEERKQHVTKNLNQIWLFVVTKFSSPNNILFSINPFIVWHLQ